MLIVKIMLSVKFKKNVYAMQDPKTMSQPQLVHLLTSASARRISRHTPSYDQQVRQ